MSGITLEELNKQVTSLLNKKETSSLALALAGNLSNLAFIVSSVPDGEARKQFAMFVAGVVAMQAKAIAAIGGYVEGKNDNGVRGATSDTLDRGESDSKGDKD